MQATFTLDKDSAASRNVSGNLVLLHHYSLRKTELPRGGLGA